MDLEVLAAWVSRPGATPAPKPDPERLAVLTADTDLLVAGTRRDVADLNAAVARSRRARGADIHLGEVA